MGGTFRHLRDRHPLDADRPRRAASFELVHRALDRRCATAHCPHLSVHSPQGASRDPAIAWSWARQSWGRTPRRLQPQRINRSGDRHDGRRDPGIHLGTPDHRQQAVRPPWRCGGRCLGRLGGRALRTVGHRSVPPPRHCQCHMGHRDACDRVHSRGIPDVLRLGGGNRCPKGDRRHLHQPCGRSAPWRGFAVRSRDPIHAPRVPIRDRWEHPCHSKQVPTVEAR